MSIFRKLVTLAVILVIVCVFAANGADTDNNDKNSTDEDAEDIEDNCEWTPCKFIDSDQLKCRNGCKIVEMDRDCHYDDFAKYKCCC